MLLIDFKLEKFFSLVIGVDKKRFQLRKMSQHSQFAHEGGNEEGPEAMVDIFAVGFEGRMNFFLTKMQGISPADIPVFHEQDIGILTVVLPFEETVVKARVDHKDNIGQIKGVSNSVLIEQDLFLKPAQLF